MPFVKGQSGNPGGMAKITREQRQFTAWAQKTAVRKVWKTLKEFIEGSDKKQRQWAAEVILQRAFGNPVQVNQNENWDMTPEKQLPDAELINQAAELLKEELDALRVKTPEAPGNSTGTSIPTIQ